MFLPGSNLVALQEAYRVPIPKRRKGELPSVFVVDDRGVQDKDSRGKLYSYFCEITVEVIDDNDTVAVALRNNVPESTGVTMWLKFQDAEVGDGRVRFLIRKGEEDALADLSATLRAMVGPGKRYKVASYKYVCPRIASALDRLRKVLTEFWGTS
jgi:hypothetical protein